MRWTVRISLLVLLAWAVFMVSPFLALHSLARAVEARDMAEIRERVNFQAVRISLSKQLVAAYLAKLGRGKELEGIDRQVATEVGATLAEPLVAELVTPEALLDLLEDGWPQTVAKRPSAAPTGFSLDLSSLGTMFQVFVRSESRGFRNIHIPIPPDRPAKDAFRLHLRLSGTTWRLTGVELPNRVRRELVRRLPRADS